MSFNITGRKWHDQIDTNIQYKMKIKNNKLIIANVTQNNTNLSQVIGNDTNVPQESINSTTPKSITDDFHNISKDVLNKIKNDIKNTGDNNKNNS